MCVRNTAAQFFFVPILFTPTGAPGIPAFSGGGGHWVVLASVLGAWSRFWFGGWNFFLELESSATAHIEDRYQFPIYLTATAYFKPLCGIGRL